MPTRKAATPLKTKERKKSEKTIFARNVALFKTRVSITNKTLLKSPEVLLAYAEAFDVQHRTGLKQCAAHAKFRDRKTGDERKIRKYSVERDLSFINYAHKQNPRYAELVAKAKINFMADALNQKFRKPVLITVERKFDFGVDLSEISDKFAETNEFLHNIIQSAFTKRSIACEVLDVDGVFYVHAHAIVESSELKANKRRMKHEKGPLSLVKIKSARNKRYQGQSVKHFVQQVSCYMSKLFVCKASDAKKKSVSEFSGPIGMMINLQRFNHIQNTKSSSKWIKNIRIALKTGLATLQKDEKTTHKTPKLLILKSPEVVLEGLHFYLHPTHTDRHAQLL